MNDRVQQLLQRLWLDGLDKRLPALATLLALVLLTHSMAILTWKVVPMPEVPGQNSVQQLSQQRTQTAQQLGSQSNRPLADTIANWNLFGKFEVEKPKPVAVQPVETAPDTKLNLKLRGVFASTNPQSSRAIIADAKGDEDSYKVGSTVPGGAVLNEIFSDKVILDTNGRLEVLRLPADETDGVIGRVEPATPPSSVRQTGSAIPSASTSGDTSSLLKSYRDALLNDPQSVMGLVRAEPFQKDGQLVGYRIRPGNDRQLLRKFGLRSGDVVTAVNGVPLNNPIKALEVLRDLSTATQLTVDVERRGVPQSFTFAIDN